MFDMIGEQIIALLERDARQTSDAVAKKINVSSATVRRRLKRMLNGKEINFAVYRNPSRGGFPAAALIGLNIEHSVHEKVTAKILKLPEVCWISTTTGRFDGFVFVRAKSNEHLFDFLSETLLKIAGIKDSETFICMSLRSGLKGFYQPGTAGL